MPIFSSISVFTVVNARYSTVRYILCIYYTPNAHSYVQSCRREGWEGLQKIQMAVLSTDKSILGNLILYTGSAWTSPKSNVPCQGKEHWNNWQAYLHTWQMSKLIRRSLTWKIWKPIGRHLLSWQCWRRVTFTLLFPGPAGMERGKQGLIWKEGKFLLPPALCPFFQHPCSCTVSHSPAGSSSERAASGGGGFTSLSNIRENKTKCTKIHMISQI